MSNCSPARVWSAAEYPPCPGERQVGLGATHASHAKPPVHPTAAQAVRSSINEEIPRGYVIAELYQDISPDVASGVYGEEGIPEGTDWPHEPISQSGSVGPEIAFQEGRDEWSPVPTQTPVAPDAVESHSYTGAIPDVCWMR